MERERVWMAHRVMGRVVVRRYLVLAPGEEIDDDPPTEYLTAGEWQQRHLEFDCNLDGTPRTPGPGVGMPADEERGTS